MTKSTGVGRGFGAGRPPKYNEKVMLPIVQAMTRLGATDVELAQALGVNITTLWLWSRQHPKFLKSLKPPKKVANERVERSLFIRAHGYTYDTEEIHLVDHVEEIPVKDQERPTVVRTKKVLRVPVTKHVPPDATSMIFWLKNRDRQKWRDYKAIEHSSPPGKPVRFKNDGESAEAELIGAYYKRLAAIAAGECADSGSDPGVGETGSESHEPGSGSESDTG